MSAEGSKRAGGVVQAPKRPSPLSRSLVDALDGLRDADVRRIPSAAFSDSMLPRRDSARTEDDAELEEEYGAHVPTVFHTAEAMSVAIMDRMNWWDIDASAIEGRESWHFAEVKATSQVATSQEQVHEWLLHFAEELDLESSCLITSLVLLERALQDDRLSFEPRTWRRVTLSAMIVASKSYYDATIWNSDFGSILPEGEITATELCAIERDFIRLIDYRILVTPKLHAMYCFALQDVLHGLHGSPSPLRRGEVSRATAPGSPSPLRRGSR